MNAGTVFLYLASLLVPVSPFPATPRSPTAQHRLVPDHFRMQVESWPGSLYSFGSCLAPQDHSSSQLFSLFHLHSAILAHLLSNRLQSYH